MAVDTKKLVADDVQVLVPGTGHWLAGRPPEAMLTALTAFLTRIGTEGPWRTTAPHAVVG
jgi:hypothetical protein